ncbi:MAG: 2-oxoacid:acceptor oxidoreductase family protein [Candidatus Omnitrophota bacterium]
MTKKTDLKIKGTTNVLFCGTGGQGVLAAAEILGWAAIYGGYHVKKSEVHGMAQRGGSVESHVRFGGRVFSPLIPEGRVDFLVSFLKDESIRMKHSMAVKGVDLTDDLDKANGALSEKRYLNSYLLGVLSRYLTIRTENWFAAIDHVFFNKNPQGNKDAFLQGRGDAK